MSMVREWEMQINADGLQKRRCEGVQIGYALLVSASTVDETVDA